MLGRPVQASQVGSRKLLDSAQKNSLCGRLEVRMLLDPPAYARARSAVLVSLVSTWFGGFRLDKPIDPE
jgi:hypothetical protein